MLSTLWTRLEQAERRFRRSWGKDISTPGARRWSKLHYHLFDHAFLRIFWTNFWPVAPGVWRSNQPTHPRFERYARMGIRTVVNLRGEEKYAHFLFARESCAALGLTLITAKLHARSAASRSALLHVIEVLRAAEKPMVFHCKSGADRAGLVAALYLLVFENRPVDEAKRQLGLKYAHLKFTKTGVQDYLLDIYEARLLEGAIGFEAWIRDEYRSREVQIGWDTRRPARALAAELMRRRRSAL